MAVLGEVHEVGREARHRTLLNLDEAALIIKGPGGTKIEKVGAKLTLSAKGTYHITMVEQAPDDNHLTLKIT